MSKDKVLVVVYLGCCLLHFTRQQSYDKPRQHISVLKCRGITLPTKVRIVKAIVFPVVMYRCESRTMKKTDHRRTDAFKLWCWRRLLRVPWTARRSNQSILKEITLNVHWKDCCWSWRSNILITWWEKLTHWKRPWCLERLKAGGKEDDSGWDGWITPLNKWTWVWASSRRWWRTRKPGVLQSMGSQRAERDLATEEQPFIREWGADSC